MSEQTALPIIDQDLIDRVFAILEKMDVVLDENPLLYGPQRLNMKVAQSRQMLTGTERLFQKVSKWLQKYKAAHRSAELSLNLSKKHLFANDPETRAGRNQTTQDAIAETKLADEVREVHHLAQVIEDLTVLMSVIKAKRSDLRDIQGRIRDQMKLCHEEIGLGNQWGSKMPPSTGEVSDPEGRTTLRELTKILQGVKTEGEDEHESDEPEDEISQEEEDRIESLLSGGGEEASSPFESDPDLVDDLEIDAQSEAEEESEEEASDPPTEEVLAIDPPKSKVDLDDLFGDSTPNSKAAPTSDADADKVLEELATPSKEPKKTDIDIDSILDDFGLS